jgi:hypothetical protein
VKAPLVSETEYRCRADLEVLATFEPVKISVILDEADDGSEYRERATIGQRTWLMPGYVNRGSRHPSRLAWYHFRPPRRHDQADPKRLRVDVPVVVTCRSGTVYRLERRGGSYANFSREHVADEVLDDVAEDALDAAAADAAHELAHGAKGD